MARGNLNIIAQTQLGQLSGGATATKFVTTDGSVRITGNLLMTDSHGNAVDAGVSATGLPSGSSSATPIIDDNGNAVFDATGNWVFLS